VTGTVSLSPDRLTLSFVPDTLLQSQTMYTLTIAATLRDLTGNPIGSPFVSHFTTVDLTPPPPPPAEPQAPVIATTETQTIVLQTLVFDK
jgi:hypothetical protein